MHERIRAKVWALVWLCFFTVGSFAHGEGFRVLGQGSSGTAQGDAFAAQADDPSAVFYNPAGLTQQRGYQLSASTLFIGGRYEYRSPSGGHFTGDVGGTVFIPPPTNFYVTASLDKLGQSFGTKLLDQFALGFGVNSPFGLGINWPNTVPFSSVTTFAALPLVDVKPTIAYKVNDYLSVGAGLDIYTFMRFLGEGKLRARSIIAPGVLGHLDGKDTATGFNLGFLLSPWRTKIDTDTEKPRLNLAFVYRSAATLNLKGDFKVNGITTAKAAFDLKLPQTFTLGAAVWPIRDHASEWKLETDVDYVDWSSFKNLDIRLSNGVTLSEPRKWKGVPTIKLGTEYKILQLAGLQDWELSLRAGYVRANSPVPQRTFEPRIPNSDFNGFSTGLGVTCKGNATFLNLFQCGGTRIDAIGLDLIYKNQIYDSRTIQNNINPVVDGMYKTQLHSGGIGVRINFK